MGATGPSADPDLGEKYFRYAWTFFKEAVTYVGPILTTKIERPYVAAVVFLRTSHEISAGGGDKLKENHDVLFVNFVRHLRNLHLHQGDILRIDASDMDVSVASDTDPAPEGTLMMVGEFDISLDPRDLRELDLEDHKRETLETYLEQYDYAVQSALLDAFRETAKRFGFDFPPRSGEP